MLLRLSLPLSDKVKHYRAIALHTIKRQPYGSCQLPITRLQNMIISYNKKKNQVFNISNHNTPCKNNLDVHYFVCCKFYVAATGLSKNSAYLRIKTTTIVRQIDSVLTFSRTGRSHTWFN